MSLPTVQVPDNAPSLGELGQLLPDYEEFRCIGVGAMGVVFEALHCPLQRKVAVKVLNPTMLANRQTVERFFREARAMARIAHPNIVPVYEVGGEGQIPFFAMELIPGGSLKERLQEDGPMDPREAAKIARDIAGALRYAHEAGILHRDIKPGNVLLDAEGKARLTDFGLVRRTDSATLTATDAIVGTPQYMSPEQVRAESLDGRSDQFSLGATLYECLTGTAPFVGDNPMSVLRAICDAQPRSLRKHRAAIPGSLEAIVVRMLEKDPAHRYLDMGAVQLDLERFLRGEAVEATLPGVVTRGWRRLRSNRLAYRIAVALVLIAIPSGYFFWLQSLEREGAEDRASIEAWTRALTSDPVEAARLETQISSTFLSSPEAHTARALAATFYGKHEEALTWAEGALQAKPDDAEMLRVAMESSIETEDLRKARRFLGRLQRLKMPEESSEADPSGAKPSYPPDLSLEVANLDRRFAHQMIGEYERLIAQAGDAGLPEVDRQVFAMEAVDARLAAAFYLSNARRMLRLYEQTYGASGAPFGREAAIVACLEVFLVEDPQERLAKLDEAYRKISAIVTHSPFDIEALTFGRMIMQLVASSQGIGPDRQTEAARYFERYGFMLDAAQGAMNLARKEMELSVQSMVSPSAEPVVGPLGRARDAVGGLIGGIFGGGSGASGGSDEP